MKLRLFLIFTYYFGASFHSAGQYSDTSISKEKGVTFVQGLTWDQVKDKAKSEGKWIFVDCYATWCGPCKAMDQSVYSNDTVGRIMNDKFISIKVQMDTAKNDNDAVKMTYGMAVQFDEKYRIQALPTFLFFNSDGIALHKEIGYQSVKEFMEILNNLDNPGKQLYTVVHQWPQIQIAPKDIPELVQKLENIEEDSIADLIAMDYMHSYLDKLPEDRFLERQNLSFMANNCHHTTGKDRIFGYYLNHSFLVDSVIGQFGLSKNRIHIIISRDDIAPALKMYLDRNATPDWAEVKKQLLGKYERYDVEYCLMEAKVKWFKSMKYWKEYTQSLIQEVKLRGDQSLPAVHGGSVFLNNCAWEIFKYSNSKEEMTEAIGWTNRILTSAIDSEMRPNTMDTKACLIYKMGMNKEAIRLEKEALSSVKDDRIYFEDRLSHMATGKKIWLNAE